MKTKILAWLYAFVVTLAPSIAWAQVQPTPIFQAKTALDLSLANATDRSVVIDTSGIGSFYVRAYNVNCADNGATAGLRVAFGGGITAALLTDFGFSSNAIRSVNNATAQYYEVGPLPMYVEAVVTATSGAACNATVEVTFSPLPNILTVQGTKRTDTRFDLAADRPVVVAGIAPDGANFNVAALTMYGDSLKVTGSTPDGAAFLYYPLVVGGMDPATGFAQTLQVDATGALVTAGTSTGTMPTAVPTAVNLSANVSGTVCSLTPEAYYRIWCNAAAQWRQGAATPTAVTTDNELGAGILVDTQMDADDTCIAFISSSAATCKVSRLGPAP